MMQKFQATLQQKGGVTYLKLSGVIDEDNELFDLVDKIGPGTLVINLADIERINSCGVRDWVNWLSRLEKKGVNVVLVECSPAIVAQINLVSNFTGNGIVKSFYAPYFCPSCNLEKVLLIDMEEMKAMDRPKAPVCRCDECDGVMDFDDMEDSYFAFVVTAKDPVMDPEVEKTVSELSNEESVSEASGGRKVKTRSTGSFVGTGTSSSRTGSQVSSVSLPSLPSVPSLPSLPSLANLEQSNPELVAKLQRTQPKAPASKAASKTNLVLAVIVVLLIMAIALLLYVIFLGPTGGQKGGGSASAPATSFALPALLSALATSLFEGRFHDG